MSSDDQTESPEATKPAPGDARPTDMPAKEVRYGYAVAAELVVVAVLNLVVVNGPGAPAHPQRLIQVVGLATSLVLFPILRSRNRFFVAMSAMVAAFFVSLPAVPNSLRLVHLFALVFPFGYAFLLTQRQRKAALAAGYLRKSRPSRKASPGAEATTTRRRDRRGSRGNATTPGRPERSGRYTPPKQRTRRR